MTREEAAEEILKGPFTKCWYCEGRGHMAEKDVLSPYLHPDCCRHCQGRGKWWRGDYVQACIELGIEPVAPPTAKTDKGPFFDPIEFKKMLGDIYLRPPNRIDFRREYMGDWSQVELEADLATQDQLDAVAYALKHRHQHEVPVLANPRLFNPKRFKL